MASSQALVDLKNKTSDMHDKWLKVRDIMNFAYKDAYKSQTKILADAFTKLGESQKGDEAFLTVACAIVTAGVLGPIGGAFLVPLESDVAELGTLIASDTALFEWAGKSIKAMGEQGVELSAHFAGDIAADPPPISTEMHSRPPVYPPMTSIENSNWVSGTASIK